MGGTLGHQLCCADGPLDAPPGGAAPAVQQPAVLVPGQAAVLRFEWRGAAPTLRAAAAWDVLPTPGGASMPVHVYVSSAWSPERPILIACHGVKVSAWPR
jgi:hypothetical protein